jgi:broad specificity phosphatase PhoE
MDQLPIRSNASWIEAAHDVQETTGKAKRYCRNETCECTNGEKYDTLSRRMVAFCSSFVSRKQNAILSRFAVICHGPDSQAFGP